MLCCSDNKWEYRYPGYKRLNDAARYSRYPCALEYIVFFSGVAT